jgi:WD40 repeat protein
MKGGGSTSDDLVPIAQRSLKEDAIPALTVVGDELPVSRVQDIARHIHPITIKKLKRRFPPDGFMEYDFVEAMMEEIVISNKDKKLRDERQLTLLVALLHAMFKQVDVNGNGLLDWSEFTGWCVSVGMMNDTNDEASGHSAGGGSGGTAGDPSAQMAGSRSKSACAPDREDAYRLMTRKAVTPLPPSARMHRLKLGSVAGSAPLPVLAIVEKSSAVVLVDPTDQHSTSGMLEVFCVERKQSIAPGPKAADAARSALVVALDAVHLEGRDEIAISASDHFISIWRRADYSKAAQRAKQGSASVGTGDFSSTATAAAAQVKLNWAPHKWARAFACPSTQTTLCWCPSCPQHAATLLSAGVDFVITLWDVVAGEPMFRLREHRDFVTAIVYLERTAMFASASLDRTVQIWSMQQRKCVRKRILSSKQPVKKLSATAEMLVTCGNFHATAWDLSLGSKICDLGGHRAPLVGAVAVAFIDHTRGPQQRCITADEQVNFRVWNVSVAETSADGSAELIQAFDLSGRPCGGLTMPKPGTALNDDVVEPESDTEGNDEPQAPAKDNAAGTDSTALAAMLANNGGSVMFDFVASAPPLASSSCVWPDIVVSTSGRRLSLLRATKADRPQCPVSQLLVNTTAETIVGVVGNEVRIWDMHTSTQVNTITLKGITSAEITSVTLDRPLERKLYLGTSTGEIVAVNYVTGELMGEPLHEHEDAIIALYAEALAIVDPVVGQNDRVASSIQNDEVGQKHIVSIGADRRILVWLEDVEGEVEVLRNIENVHGVDEQIMSGTFSSTLSLIVTGARGGEIRVWDFEQCTLEDTLVGHQHDVTCLSWVPGFSLLVSGDANGDVLIWSMRGNQKPITTHENGADKSAEDANASHRRLSQSSKVRRQSGMLQAISHEVLTSRKGTEDAAHHREFNDTPAGESTEGKGALVAHPDAQYQCLIRLCPTQTPDNPTEIISVTSLTVLTEVHMSVLRKNLKERQRRSSQLKRSTKAFAVVAADVSGNTFMWNIVEVLLKLRLDVSPIKNTWLQRESFNPNRRYSRDMDQWNQLTATPKMCEPMHGSLGSEHAWGAHASGVLQLCVFTCTPQLLTAAADCTMRLWATKKTNVGPKRYKPMQLMGEINLTDFEDECVARAEGWAFPIEATLRHIQVYRSDYCVNVAQQTLEKVQLIENPNMQPDSSSSSSSDDDSDGEEAQERRKAAALFGAIAEERKRATLLLKQENEQNGKEETKETGARRYATQAAIEVPQLKKYKDEGDTELRSWALESALEERQHKSISEMDADAIYGGDDDDSDEEEEFPSSPRKFAEQQLAKSKSMPALSSDADDLAVGEADGAKIEKVRAALRSSNQAKTRDGRIVYTNLYGEMGRKRVLGGPKKKSTSNDPADVTPSDFLLEKVPSLRKKEPEKAPLRLGTPLGVDANVFCLTSGGALSPGAMYPESSDGESEGGSVKGMPLPRLGDRRRGPSGMLPGMLASKSADSEVVAPSDGGGRPRASVSGMPPPAFLGANLPTAPVGEASGVNRRASCQAPPGMLPIFSAGIANSSGGTGAERRGSYSGSPTPGALPGMLPGMLPAQSSTNRLVAQNLLDNGSEGSSPRSDDGSSDGSASYSGSSMLSDGDEIKPEVENGDEEGNADVKPKSEADVIMEQRLPELRHHWSDLMNRFNQITSEPSPRQVKKSAPRRRKQSLTHQQSSNRDDSAQSRVSPIKRRGSYNSTPFGPYSATQIDALGKILVHIDQNLDGEIDPEEFAAAAKHGGPGGALFAGVDFTMIDRDGSGAISLYELAAVLFGRAKPEQRKMIIAHLKKVHYGGRLD